MTTDEKLLRIESSLKEIDSTLDIILKKIAVPKTQRVMEVKTRKSPLYNPATHRLWRTPGDADAWRDSGYCHPHF